MADDKLTQLLKAAFAAVLRGDLAERDRLCGLAREEMDRQRKAHIIEVVAQRHRQPGQA